MEATKDSAEYIVEFYNCVRLHSTLGNLSPVIYETEMAAEELVDVSENT